MTRFKRRKTASALKMILLLSLPFTAALSVKCLPDIKAFAKEISSVRINQETHREEVFKHNVSRKEKKQTVENEILGSSITLSEGYGYSAEDELPETSSGLADPLKTVSADPGPKPYPADDEWTEGLEIVRTAFGKYSGNAFFDLEKCGQVKNLTDIPNDTLYAESRLLPNFTVTDTDQPQVLIYHTHTTESYEPFVRSHSDASFNYRTTDDTKNMVMVGNAIQAELEAAGIGVVHVTEIHDYPSYNGSYERSRASITPILEQYPDIKVALDIHRDAISGDGNAVQPIVEIDGREAAQIMIISGCDDGTMDMPNYMKNFHFACSLQQQIEGDYEGLTRPILFDYRHYNQDLTTGSLLIEVGSHCNTLGQAQYSGQLIGRSLSRLLNSIKEKK